MSSGGADVFCPGCGKARLRPVGLRAPGAVWRCPSCMGIWASREAASAAPRTYGVGHPVLLASAAPARCRRCRQAGGGEATCAACGATQVVACVQCGREMERARVEAIVVDLCRPCRCLWFDRGELGALIRLHRRRAAPPTPAPQGRRSSGRVDVPDPTPLLDLGHAASAAPEAVAAAGEGAIELVTVAGDSAIDGVVAIGEAALAILGGLFEGL